MSNSKKCLIEFINRDVLNDPKDTKLFYNQFDLVASKFIKAGISDGIEPIQMVRALLGHCRESLLGGSPFGHKEATEAILREAIKDRDFFADCGPEYNA